MTEKRFVDYFDKDHNYIIQDLKNEDEYQVGFVHCDEDVFLELVNNLNEENEELKKENEQLRISLGVGRTNANSIVDVLNCQEEENEQLKQDNNALIKMLENQSVIIQKLHSKILEYELKEPIALTKEDLEIMGKAISYYSR